MKIYAIMNGNYSDYHICALTTDKERAKQLQKIYTSHLGEPAIEEYEDGEIGKDIHILWQVRLDNMDAFPMSDPDTSEQKEPERIIDGFWNDKAHVYAVDKEHAKKKAQDMYAEYKAKKEGII